MSKIDKRVLEYVLVVIIFFTVFSENVCSAVDSAEALFKRGLLQYKQGKYVSARLDFNEIIAQHSHSSYITSSYMLLAKTFYNLGDFSKSASIALELQKLYPYSRYNEWADYLISACDFQNGNVREAMETLAYISGRTADENLKNHAMEALLNVIKPQIDRDIFLKALSENNVSETELENIKPVAEVISVKVQDNTDIYTPETTWNSGNTIKIGLLAPLTGEYSKQGNQLLRGVNVAKRKQDAINDKKIELIVEDTESDPITTMLKVREFAAKGVMAIIGPVYGESTITAAIEANTAHIPFIAPTAQDGGLTLIGPYIFQLNFTPAVQAKALADFAVKSLRFTNAAVIASDDRWGESVAVTFENEMQKYGVQIINTAFFDTNITLHDYNPIMSKLRELAPESTAVPESTVVIDNGNAFPDTMIVKLDPTLFGPQRLPMINTINGILISALAPDALQIAKHISEYNIDTVLLGDSGWSTQILTEEWETSVEGAYTVSLGNEFFSTEDGIFNEGLDNIISLKGYDAFSLVMDCFEEGAYDSGSLVDKLESVRDFKGLSSQITIDPKTHTNIAVNIAKIQNGTFIKIPYNFSISGN
ncbi:MAG: penicillin-binding protein activator [Candidatus Latescibacteria bacterium]|nr:penicillin-binding protein activator [Candidatus Latescibacterota bacterium]